MKKYSGSILGMSQNPNTKDYILIYDKRYLESHCIKCGKRYTDINNQWCKPCQINYLKEIFMTSGDEMIDEFIQGMQKINHPQDIIIEWIKYDQFSDFKEIKKNNLATATWKDGPLYYKNDTILKEYKRESNKVVTLKYLDSSQIRTSEFLNKVKF
jgi:hypothetical protein